MTETVLVAYQGEPGCYSEEASRTFFGQDVECVPCGGFSEVFLALKEGRATRAVLPIENVLAGTIHQNLDLIVASNSIHIVGEVEVDVRHCLLAASDRVALEDVRVARSHYMALAQCDKFLGKHNIRAEVAADTAGSARELSLSNNNSYTCAIASRGAAKRYGLHVLREGIGNYADNYTRFWVLSHAPTTSIPISISSLPKANINMNMNINMNISIPKKTSIAFTLENGPGKLVQALTAFAFHDIDLTKIESRHVHSLGINFVHPAHKLARWQYIFYLDIVGGIDDRNVEMALESLKCKTAFYRLLGSYERFSAPSTSSGSQHSNDTNGTNGTCNTDTAITSHE